MTDLYQNDFYSWLHQQANLLEQGKFDQLDLENLTEEVDCMGKRHLSKLEQHLTLLVMHLLKWQYQPEKRACGHSWEISIKAHRQQAKDVLKKHPSLKNRLNQLYAELYSDAVDIACIETRLDKSAFPAQCPWTFEQVSEDGWLPQD